MHDCLEPYFPLNACHCLNKPRVDCLLILFVDGCMFYLHLYLIRLMCEIQEKVGSSDVEAMLSQSAPVFNGDIRSHERVIC